MNKYVNVEVAKEYLRHDSFDNPYFRSQACRQAMDVLDTVPAADVVERPRWIPVTEALPESIDDDVLVTDGEGCAVGYWRPDAQAWDSTDFGWLENRSEPPCGIHTVTHWMPLPPLPEPPKEEEPDVQSKI